MKRKACPRLKNLTKKPPSENSSFPRGARSPTKDSRRKSRNSGVFLRRWPTLSHWPTAKLPNAHERGTRAPLQEWMFSWLQESRMNIYERPSRPRRGGWNLHSSRLPSPPRFPYSFTHNKLLFSPSPLRSFLFLSTYARPSGLIRHKIVVYFPAPSISVSLNRSDGGSRRRGERGREVI